MWNVRLLVTILASFYTEKSLLYTLFVSVDIEKRYDC